ncbi:MAG: VCBS repeat-containing protein [Acidobacteria bacterium]|nr:VCBS repeat-containing protein [Acidobacteriota bacterium]
MLPVFLLCTVVSAQVAVAEITASMFHHRFIAREMPGGNVGFGASALADFDRDGDLDFAVVNRGDRKVYWFEQKSRSEWVRHWIGDLPVAQLGGAVMDVDSDGWPDLVVGGFWFHNRGKPAGKPFDRYRYDSTIRSEIHDMVASDIDHDGKPDVVAMGDGEGCFWYAIPSDPVRDVEWKKSSITTEVLNDKTDIHSGFYPAGIGDLDGDGDPDIFLADRWMENRDGGKQWMPHRVFFGRRGPWGFSTRSVILDLDKDGDTDVVVTDSDGQNSGVGWLENNGKTPPGFTTHYLGNKAAGTRGSFHSLRVADFDRDGDPDILVIEQEDPSILPVGAGPRWYVWENLTKGGKVEFEERVILDARLGGHDVWTGDVDGDGDIDIVSKIWRVWGGNGNGGRVHVDWLENRLR